MRLIKLLGLAVLALAVTAAIGASSASALKPAQLCKVHLSLDCPQGQAVTEDHQVLAPGTVWRLLGSITILCLSALKLATPLELAKPQQVHTLYLELTGCGTGSSHDNCTIEVEELPLLHLLKIGLDAGVLTALNGALRVQCGSFIDCLIDLEGAEFTMGAQHTTADDVPVRALGNPFFCPAEEPLLDFLLKTLENHYVLR
jgi:hypothetical protein